MFQKEISIPTSDYDRILFSYLLNHITTYVIIIAYISQHLVVVRGKVGNLKYSVREFDFQHRGQIESVEIVRGQLVFKFSTDTCIKLAPFLSKEDFDEFNIYNKQFLRIKNEVDLLLSHAKLSI